MEHMIIDTLFLFNIADMYFHIKKNHGLAFVSIDRTHFIIFFKKKMFWLFLLQATAFINVSKRRIALDIS